MTMRHIRDQLTKYLADVHSIEHQAISQLRAAPKLADDPEIAGIFAAHLEETERQEARVKELLDARGASPSAFKDIAGYASGKAFVLFARSQPDTTGKLMTHAYSYEHMELAAYDLLARIAERAGEPDVAEVARAIREEEAAMAKRIAALWDRSVEVSLAEQDADDLDEQVAKYLADAHALEAQSIQLLEKGPALAGTDDLAALYAEHLEESRGQQKSIEARLTAHDAAPNRLQDALLRLGALNWGGFFAAQPDTPAKLAGFAFAVEHLEIGGYEQLKRVAVRAGDTDTARIASEILVQEHAAAERIRNRFDQAVDAALADLDVKV